ncbi:hypothetical protein ACJJTC_004833 [Scirpophaga incertulas]
MRQLIILLVLIAAVHGLGPWQGGLRVRYDLNPLGIGKTSFIGLPRTIAEAKDERWVKTPRPDGPMPSLVMFCPSKVDKLACCLFDDTGYIAGLQFALPTDVFSSHSGMDMETLGFTLWTPPVTSGSPRSYWTAHQYYVDEEFLEKSVEVRLAERNNKKTLQADSIWVSGFHGERMKISRDSKEIGYPKTLFVKQTCFIMMGRHYYYNMTELTLCDDEHFLPWFPLVHSGELIGVGFFVFGKMPEESLPESRNYFERSSRKQIEFIVSHGPECLFDLVEHDGIISVHSYFVDKPWLINCIGE